MTRDAILLGKSVDAAQRAMEIVGSLPVDDLEADRLRLDAVLWNLTILGEAISRSSNNGDITEKNPNRLSSLNSTPQPCNAELDQRPGPNLPNPRATSLVCGLLRSILTLPFDRSKLAG